MSKAFTREDGPDEPPLLRAAPQLAPGEIRYVTPEGHAALREEADRLRASLAEARSEASPETIARLAVLDATLAQLTVLGPESAPEGRVAFGTWVEVEDEDGERSLWRIVGPDEASPRQGQVSVNAPVGSALVGREVGESVEVTLPGPRHVELTVLAVHKTKP